jgi:hypothetical protein
VTAVRFYWLVLGILSVWRITHLLQAEDGPWDLLVHFRRAVGATILGALFECFYCLSIWTAIPFAYFIGETWIEKAVLWPALSGGAILIERLTTNDHEDLPAVYFEEEGHDALLRKTERELP